MSSSDSSAAGRTGGGEEIDRRDGETREAPGGRSHDETWEEPSAGPDPALPRVLFLMGYGRSGSTFTDILLNNAGAVTSVGALSNYWLWLAEELPCACGVPLRDCSLWGEVVPAHLDGLPHRDVQAWNEVQEAVESRANLVRLLTGRVPDGLLDRYRVATEGLLTRVLDRIETPAIVDSSGSGGRSTGRAYALTRHTGADVRVIHLVRDGRAVAWSSLRGPGSPERTDIRLPRPLKALRTGASWCLYNLLCEAIRQRLGAGRVLRVRYEDLATRPADELRRVGTFAGLDLRDLIEKVEADRPLEVGHNVAGNRLRFRDAIRIRPDFSWRSEMPLSYRWMLDAELWPLLLRYRYLP